MTAAQLSQWIADSLFLAMIVGIPLYGYYKKLPVFETFVAGAQEGFQVIIKIFPFLLGMLVAIGMLRASGVFAILGTWLAPVFNQLGVPHEILPLALVRPLSGAAANGVLADLITTHGGDSFIAKLGATIMGSTETTFYVLAVYFGAVGIARTRHALPVGLLADLTGVIASVAVCRWLL
jgi:spore maturation protein B